MCYPLALLSLYRFQGSALSKELVYLTKSLPLCQPLFALFFAFFLDFFRSRIYNGLYVLFVRVYTGNTIVCVAVSFGFCNNGIAEYLFAFFCLPIDFRSTFVIMVLKLRNT